MSVKLLWRALGALAVVALAVGANAEESKAKSAEEIIALNLKARGGLEKITAMKTAVMSGKMGMGGMDVPFRVEWKRPNKVRREFTMQGMTGIMAYDGETAWQVMPFMGQTAPEKMPESQSKELVEQADLEGALVNYKEKGHQVEYLGTADVEGTPAYKLKVTRKSGEVVNYYIDTETNLEIKADMKQEMNGQEMEMSIFFSDYKESGGLMFPYTFEMRIPGMPAGQVLTFDKIELDGEIAADRFAMPAAPEAAKP